MEETGDTAQDTSNQSRPRRAREAKRSRKGCPECRGRKIKCDERQPRCGQCQKRGRTCHLQDSVFKQHAFSFESAPVTVHAARLDSSGRREETVLASTVSPPRNGRQSAVDNGTDGPGAAGSRREAPATPSEISYPHPRFPLDQVPVHNLPTEPPLLGGIAGNLCQFDSNSSLHGGGTPCFPIDTGLPRDLESLASPQTITSSVSPESTIGSLKDTQEELFLLRHYSECIAPWMDLLYRYEVFSREVLMLAREHPILRYAACAVAAKQLGQMRHPVSAVLRGKTQEKIAARLVRSRLGFVWYGIKYYEKAIQTLVKSITPREPQTSQATSNSYPSPAVSLSQGDLMVRAEGEDPIVRLLGTCILIQYEHLSANRDAWSGHLTGFWKLLGLIDNGKLLEKNPMFEQVYPWTKDIMEVKAGFWNFVVNDLEESLVSHRRTRIDTENLALWRNMGLLVEDDGRLTLASCPNSLSTTAEHVRDKVLSYFLIRLLCKLVDYLAPLPRWEACPMSGPARDFVHLESQIDTWYQMLSPSFHPDGTFVTAEDDEGRTTSGLFNRETWFSNDLCSTTMMYYHMARLLLLIHRPSDLVSATSPSSGGVSFDLLRSFRETEQKLRLHAAEVISIVRGTPCDAVKLRAIQPLYIAGRCCASTGDRKRLVETLTGIQDSLGIATGYRIKALLEEWGASYQDFGMEARLTAEEQLG